MNITKYYLLLNGLYICTKNKKTNKNKSTKDIPKVQKDNQINMGAKCIYSFLDNLSYAVYTVTYTFVLAHQYMQSHTSNPIRNLRV